MNFGDREAGEVVRENVSVYSVSGQTLKLVSAVCEADGLGFATSPLPEQIGLELNQSAGKSFDRFLLRVVVLDEASRMHTVEIPLRINVRSKATAEKQP